MTYRYAKKHGHGRLVWCTLAAAATVLLLSVGLIFGAYAGWYRLPEFVQHYIDLTPDQNARDGTLYAEDPGREVPEGNFRASANQIPTMESGDAPCSLNLENVSGNHYSVRAVLRDEEGEVLYASRRIDPGQSIHQVTLDKTLQKGEHEALLTYELYEPGSRKMAGSMTLQLTIRVLR